MTVSRKNVSIFEEEQEGVSRQEPIPWSLVKSHQRISICQERMRRS
jgi:hypothetical protein